MSGSQSALFGGGSRWITNPKHLNRASVLNTKATLKSSNSALVNSSTAGFFTALALRGAQTSIATANTYVTVASITGSGFLVNCISPTHTAAFTPTIRITVDGTVYTLAPSAAQPIAHRLVLGPILSVASTTVESITLNGASDNGFWLAAVGGLNQITAGQVETSIPTPEAALSNGLPVLRFESSLLIEMKCDLLSGTAVDKQCGASYILDL